MHRTILAAFDFDHTITDDNTDVVVRKLLPEEKVPDDVRRLCRSSGGWIAYMEKIFELLHSNSIDVSEILKAIVGIPAVAGMERLLTELHTRDCEIIIISDSNSIFINHWLESRKLKDVVAAVFTNTARIDENGRIRLDSYHTQDWCKLSAANLCKGYILENHVEKRAKDGVRFERLMYVGDGKNDLCPILKLSENDLAFVRRNYALAKILRNTDSADFAVPKAQVVPWNDGTEILQELEKRIGLFQMPATNQSKNKCNYTAE